MIFQTFAKHLISPKNILLFKSLTPIKCYHGLTKWQPFRNIYVGNMSNTGSSLFVSPLVKNLSDKHRKMVGFWLMGMAGMCFGAVVLGGVTRLTESGLSMVDWHPFKELPPFSHDTWMAKFHEYKLYPEYIERHKQGFEMSLEDFKFIWFMEYGHRMWGRLLGAAFIGPAIYFGYKGFFNKGMKIRVGVMGALIAFQGALGWYMVKSGLDNELIESVPRVSQYRLAAHLGSAFVLYTLFFWSGLTHFLPHIEHSEFSRAFKPVRGMAHGSKTMIFITALSGAFVAGLDAGLIYNTWPKMADTWIPSDIFARDIHPKWKNFFDNAAAVQFIHRHLGEATGILTLSLWAMINIRFRGQFSRRVILCSHALAAMILCQIGLGVSTLVHNVPIWLASLHQAGSLVTLSSALALTHALRKFPK